MTQMLVTGGAGFIGSHLVAGLVEEGHRVRVLDNLSSGKLKNLSEVIADIEFLEGDLRNQSSVDQALQGVETVFHQAAFVSVPRSIEDPSTCFEVNTSGTHNLLESAREKGVNRLVLASSSAVYGDQDKMPLKENLLGTPQSPYAASKRVTEIYGKLYTEIYGLDVVSLRYFNVFGPRQSAQSDYAAVIPIFIKKLLTGESPTIFGDGEQSRDFVFVKDVVRANILASQRENLNQHIFNICSGEEYSLHELLQTLEEFIPDSSPPVYQPARPGDIYRSVGDPSRAERELGLTAGDSLAHGLQKTVAWMEGRL